MTCVSPRINVPVSLSAHDRALLFLNSRAYHEEYKRRFIMIKAAVFNQSTQFQNLLTLQSVIS